MTNSELRKCNDELRRELGCAPGTSDPMYKWMRAGEFEYLAWRGKFDYEKVPWDGSSCECRSPEAEDCHQYEDCDVRFVPRAGPCECRCHLRLEVPIKRFEKLPMCPHLQKEQWVLAIWLSSQGRTEIFQFGKCMYGFTVDLPLGMEPSDAYRGGTINDQVIGTIKVALKKTKTEEDAAFEDKREKAESDSYNRTRDSIKDSFTAFKNVPGKRGYHVSFGGVDEPQLISSASVATTQGETNGNHGSGQPDNSVGLPGSAHPDS